MTSNQSAGYGLQAVLFRKTPRANHEPTWRIEDALKYLGEIGVVPMKVHETPGYFRFRIVSPSRFRSFYTIDCQNGIYAIMGVL